MNLKRNCIKNALIRGIIPLLIMGDHHLFCLSESGNKSLQEFDSRHAYCNGSFSSHGYLRLRCLPC